MQAELLCGYLGKCKRNLRQPETLKLLFFSISMFHRAFFKIYLKVLRHVSILRDHLQGVCLYLAKDTGLFKNVRIFLKFQNTEFKIPMVSSGVVAAIHVAGVRCDRCGAMQRIAPQGLQRTPATCIAATKPELTIGILNSVF